MQLATFNFATLLLPYEWGNSLKYFVVNNVKQVQRNVNTTTPMTQAYQVYDLVVPSL